MSQGSGSESHRFESIIETESKLLKEPLIEEDDDLKDERPSRLNLRRYHSMEDGHIHLQDCENTDDDYEGTLLALSEIRKNRRAKSLQGRSFTSGAIDVY